MGIWADWCIARVRYDDHGLIDWIEVREDSEELLGHAQLWNRRQLLGDMKKGLKFSTIFPAGDGKFSKGQPARKVIVDGDTYVRTDDDPVARDWFGELPGIDEDL